MLSVESPSDSEWLVPNQVGSLDDWDVGTNGLRRLMDRQRRKDRRTWTKGPKDCKKEG